MHRGMFRAGRHGFVDLSRLQKKWRKLKRECDNASENNGRNTRRMRGKWQCQLAVSCRIKRSKSVWPKSPGSSSFPNADMISIAFVTWSGTFPFRRVPEPSFGIELFKLLYATTLLATFLDTPARTVCSTTRLSALHLYLYGR